MQKQAPSPVRILIAVGFAVSCFLLMLFLWISFGGPTPLGSKSYRITAYFPEATQLAVESDVRIGGVSVGKVKALELAPIEERLNGKDTTAAEIEIQPQYAPISQDAKAILRQKTLLGETYVELTSGTEPADGAAPVSLGAQAAGTDAEAEGAEALEEGGSLGVGQTEEATEIDEIFNALDDETRVAFQRWQKSAAVAIRNRSRRGRALERAAHDSRPSEPGIDEMRAALGGPPPRQRAALVLRFYCDLPHEDIAAVLSCTVATARSLTHRGLTTLRKDMDRWTTP